MTEIIFFITGILTASAALWYIFRSHLQRRYSELRVELQENYSKQIAEVHSNYSTQVSRLEGRASAAEAKVEELRHQIEQKESEINELRSELTDERQLRVKLEESQRYLKEEIERFEKIRNELSTTFSSLSLEALSKNSEEFLKLAEEKIRSQIINNKKELEGKKELIDQSLETIAKTLSELQKRIDEVSSKSGEKFAEIATLIRKHEEITSKLKDTTDHLRHALSSSKRRGQWGERMAEDIIRLLGMVEGINYIKQKTLEGSSGRPDYTIFMPNGLKINMDVKFPLDNYMHYLNAETEHDRKRYKEELLKNARIMIKQVTNREYINPADNTVDYVIVFIPNEQVYSFINEADITIMEEALKQKVILCSPFTLYAVLAVIRQAVENFNLEQTASQILKLLGEFSKQWNEYKKKFLSLGEKLELVKKEYDAIITTRTNMLDRPLRKIEELRKQRAITFDDEIKFGESAFP